MMILFYPFVSEELGERHLKTGVNSLHWVLSSCVGGECNCDKDSKSKRASFPLENECESTARLVAACCSALWRILAVCVLYNTQTHFTASLHLPNKSSTLCYLQGFVFCFLWKCWHSAIIYRLVEMALLNNSSVICKCGSMKHFCAVRGRFTKGLWAVNEC